MAAGRAAPRRLYQEITEPFGFRSPNAVTGHLRLLRKKGVSQRTGQGAFPAHHFPAGKIAQPHRGHSHFWLHSRRLAETREQEAEGCVSVDIESIGYKPTRNAFALRVTGDSMIGRHILDGDFVVLEHGPDPRNGQVVAALIDGESTLKTFVVKGGKPYLQGRKSEISRTHSRAGTDDSRRVQGAHPQAKE